MTQKDSRNGSRAAILVALLFLLPLSANIPSESVQPLAHSLSGKSTDADVEVTELSVTTPSTMVAGVPTLAPQNHTIRVTISNMGGSTADGILSLKVNNVQVDYRNVSINVGRQEFHLMYWNATLGSGISLEAVWEVDVSSTDSDSSNDQMTLSGIAVVAVEEASSISDSLPQEGSTVARGLWAGGITVINTGNQQVDVTAQLTLTSSLSGDQVPISSDTVTVIPGSLANPPTPQNLSLSFDGTNMEGTYTLGGSILVTGTGSYSITVDSRTVSFIAMRASLIPANNRNLDPGAQTILNFILQNSGDETDTFSVSQSNNTDISGGGTFWANVSADIYTIADPLSVAAGATEAIQVPLQVPSVAALGESVRVTITIYSISSGYVLEASTIVMAGGLYQATITQNHSYIDPTTGPGTLLPAVYIDNFANVTPGIHRTLDYTLNNTGTAPTQYQINVAATEPVPYWQIYSPVSITDVVMPGELRTIPVTIITPSIVMPLDPAWKIAAELQINLAIQAIPLEGGIPVTNQTTLIIDKVVEIDVEVIGGAGDISVSDFLSGNTVRFVDFQVQLVNNLGSGNTATQVSLDPSTDGGGTGRVYTPDASGSEAEQRWVSTIVPSTLDIRPGEIGYGTIAIAHVANSDFPYPAAGVFSFNFKAHSDWASFPGTISRNSTASASFEVAELSSAQLTGGPAVTGDPSTPIASTMTLKNTGNNLANFTIGYIPIPGWTIQVSKPAVNLLESRTNLFPLTEGPPYSDNSDTTTFTVTATPPATASADMTHELWVMVNSTETGELLAYAPVYIQLTELVSAELIPQNSTAVIDRLGQTTIMLQLNNTGNSNKTFNLTLENLDKDKIQVSFADDGTVEIAKTQLVSPGGQAIVRVYALAGTDARADDDSKFEVAVEYNGTELDRSGILVQVNPFHFIQFMVEDEYTAAPGATIPINLTMVNNGNLMETVNITASFPTETGNWTFEASASNISIEPGPLEGESVLLSITLPPLEAETILAAGVIHNVTIRVLNITDNVNIATKVISIEVLPIFAVELIESPGRIAIVPGHDRVVNYEIANAGNAPMSINLQWAVTDSDAAEDRFAVEAIISSTTLNLGIGESTSLTYRVSALAGDHYLPETGALDLIFTPLGIELDPIVIQTPIEITRVQTDDEYYFNADSAGEYLCDSNPDDRCRQIEIPWVNIPSIGYSNDADLNYTLSRISSDRLISSQWHEYAEWSFDIDGGMCQMADSGGEGIAVTPATANNCNGPGWDLPPSTTYDLVNDGENHGGTIVIQVIIPDKKSLAPGDGWDITMRLSSPTEPDSSEFWTLFTVKLRMTESSDPMIDRVAFGISSKEGATTTLNVIVINAGNARMPIGTEVQLLCSTSPYAEVTSSFTNKVVPDLEAGGNFTASWPAELSSIPWYSTSETLQCTVSLVFQDSVFGNNASNDVFEANLEIESWAPPPVAIPLGPYEFNIPSALLLSVLILFGSLVMLSKGMDENPNQLHGSAYLAAMAFGMLSLANIAQWATILAALSSIVFAGVIAWLSSSELQTIHDDRKKARIGSRALLEDHDKEQVNTRKELRAIISLAPYAFLPFVLITPSLTIDIGAIPLASILVFMAVSPVLVHFILRLLDRSYDRLYSELAEIELRAIKIKKILGSLGNRPGSGGA